MRSSYSTRQTHILLVDDDQVDVMNVQRAFARGNIGNPLHIAKDGIEALAALRNGSIPEGERRLVLLDIGMPRMNGIEFLTALRADPILQPTPVVVLTTSSDERDLVDAYRLNVAGYLIKPVTFQSFVQIMSSLSAYWNMVEMP